MNKLITYRPFKKEDISSLVTVIIESWNYEKLFSKKVAYHFAHLFLYFALIQKSFAQVAIMDGIAIGIIIGDIKNESKDFENYRYYSKLIWHGIQLFLSTEGRNVLINYAGKVELLNKKMLEGHSDRFDTELALFAVSPKAQGLGVGSNLYKYFLDTLKKKKLKDFYLYTDTSCNCGFYDYKGLNRVSSMLKLIKDPINKEIEFFLYTGKVMD